MTEVVPDPLNSYYSPFSHKSWMFLIFIKIISKSWQRNWSTSLEHFYHRKERKKKTCFSFIDSETIATNFLIFPTTSEEYNTITNIQAGRGTMNKKYAWNNEKIDGTCYDLWLGCNGGSKLTRGDHAGRHSRSSGICRAYSLGCCEAKALGFLESRSCG